MKKKINWFIFFLVSSLLITGCSDQGKPVKVTKPMDQVISDYILAHNKTLFEKTEQQFEAHKLYGARKKDSGIIDVYLYYLYEGFNRDTKTESLSGGSVPVRLKLKKVEGGYKAVGYKEAEDGSKYTDSIKEMFPKEYADQVLNVNNRQAAAQALQKKINKQVVKWLNQ